MPSSYFTFEVISLTEQLSHKSILDVGPGFGKYGMLLREYLDIWFGRYHKKSWECRIDCIEAFKDYITPVHEYIYNQIYIGKAEEMINQLPSYDLILILDVIEHLEKDIGINFIIDCKKKSSAIIIMTPKGFTEQAPYMSNQFEIHRSGWIEKDFETLGFNYKIIKPCHDKILAHWIKKD